MQQQPMVRFVPPCPYIAKLSQSAKLKLINKTGPSDIWNIRDRDATTSYICFYLIQISFSLQTNQILHDGSALCIISVAALDTGLFNFLKPKTRCYLFQNFLILSRERIQNMAGVAENKSSVLPEIILRVLPVRGSCNHQLGYSMQANELDETGRNIFILNHQLLAFHLENYRNCVNC